MPRPAQGHGGSTSQSAASASCTPPSGYLADATDCDDAGATTPPGADEVCRGGLDEDCDGTPDDGGPDRAWSGDFSAEGPALIHGDATGDQLGRFVTTADLDGDGARELVAGAGWATATWDGLTRYGVTYVFRGIPTGDTAASGAAIAFIYGDDTSGTYSPRGLARIDDLDGDGSDELAGIYDFGSNWSVRLFLGADVTGAADYTTYDLGSWSFSGPISSAGHEGGDRYGGSVIVADTDSGGAGDAIDIYAYTGSGMTRLAYANGGDGGDWFGCAGAGGEGNDVNGDGYDDVAVGAPGEYRISDHKGLVYILPAPWSSGDSIVDDALHLSGASGGGSFGRTLAAPGDVNGDGQPDLLVGDSAGGDGGTFALLENVDFDDPAHDVSGDDAAATVYGDASNDSIGDIRPATGDVDGDGETDLLVSADTWSDGATNVGAAWLIYGPLSGTYDLSDPTQYDARFTGDELYDWCGQDVALGDLDGDGRDEIVLGCPGGEGATLAYPGTVAFFTGG